MVAEGPRIAWNNLRRWALLIRAIRIDGRCSIGSYRLGGVGRRTRIRRPGEMA